jgi:hypothetical protein
MVATIDVEVWTGGTAGSPTKTNVTSGVRFRTDDSPLTQDLTNPIPIPTSGFNYSYWIHAALAISGTFSQVSNIRHYSDGAIGWTLGTGGEVRRGNRDTGDHGTPEASYQPANGTQGTSGYSIEDGVNGHPYYNAQTTPTANIANDTSGSPATVDSGAYTAAGSTKAVVLQVKADTNATQGSQTAETFTFLYDEI